MERSRGIDILKCICAFLVVCIHAPITGNVWQLTKVLTRIAVPIFFMISGYFYNQEADSKRKGNQILKIFVLTILANILYFCWEGAQAFCIYLKSGAVSGFENLTGMFSLYSLKRFVLFNESPFGYHLWYLNALLYVLIIAFFCTKIRIFPVLYFLIPLLLAGDLALGKYSTLLFERGFSYVLVRNFLFVGLPYFMIGNLIGKYQEKIMKIKYIYILSAVVIFCLLSIGEKLLTMRIISVSTREHFFTTTLLSVAVFVMFAFFVNGKKCRTICYWGEKYSTAIYIVHPIFIDVILITSAPAWVAQTSALTVFFASLAVSAIYYELKKDGKK